MIYITNSAQEYLSKLLLNQLEGTQIRVFVSYPGTPEAECGVSYCPPNATDETDRTIQYEKLSVLVDEKSAPYLEDAEIDLVAENLSSQLTLRAPNAKTSKLKADAPLIERVEYLLQWHINPKLVSHGGRVRLVEITNEKVAILQFEGGCNGCSMVGLTLKEGIEKELLLNFSELTGVKDLTEHKHGRHSYY